MSSTLVNYASRVLSVDQESNSFVPIVGLNKSPDMPIFEAIMFAWRGCAILRAAVDEDDMEVPHCAQRLPLFAPSPRRARNAARGRSSQLGRGCTS